MPGQNEWVQMAPHSIFLKNCQIPEGLSITKDETSGSLVALWLNINNY